MLRVNQGVLFSKETKRQRLAMRASDSKAAGVTDSLDSQPLLLRVLLIALCA